MLKLENRTKSLKNLLFQASKGVIYPLFPMIFPSLGPHISGTKFPNLGLKWKETCGKVANLMAESGENKG